MKFAKMPLETAKDSRLGKNEIRVLIVLLSFADKDGFCHPKRELISDITGIMRHKISNITTNLENLGWLVKHGRGGNSKASTYQITVPNLGTVNSPEIGGNTVPKIGTVNDQYTVPKTGTVPKMGTVPKTGTPTVPKTGTPTVPKTGTRTTIHTNEQTIEQTISAKSPKNGNFFEDLPEGISVDAARGFVEHRKLMKAPLTKRAFLQAMETASRAGEIGLTPDQAIDETVQAGWRGINLGWLKNRMNGGKVSGKPDTSGWIDDVKNGKSIFGELSVIDGDYEKH